MCEDVFTLAVEEDRWVLRDGRGTTVAAIDAEDAGGADGALRAMVDRFDLFADWTWIERVGPGNRWRVHWDPHQHG